MSCSRTQRSDAGTARAGNPAVLSQAPLSHCAPKFYMTYIINLAFLLYNLGPNGVCEGCMYFVILCWCFLAWKLQDFS